ncbi:demethoxyubiquinone hydroxylase (CLK1/Coq7/Cat5 family) [Bradyrhizobium sp. USDA 4448]
MQTILDVIAFAAGFGACWLCKDTLLHFVTNTEAQVKSLETKLTALRATL